MSDKSTAILIIGAGQAGAEVAFCLRKLGCKARVILVGEESVQPYQRPPLSKAYLNGQVDLEDLYVKPAATYLAADIEVRTGVRAERIDRARKRVFFSDGSSESYDKLVLATGGLPRRLQCSGVESAQRLQNLHYLRTVEDVKRIRHQFHKNARLVLVGGGYIGLEVAAVACKEGLKVTVLEALPRVLARVTAPEVSAFYENVHRAAGVDIRTNAAVSGTETDPSGDAVSAVVLGDGSSLPVDVMIVGIGLVPATELAGTAGLVVDNGILVDAFMRTSDPDVLAVGDCACYPSTLYGRNLRIESVPNALEQARTAAATICGQERPHDAVPWFWSDQYDLKLQMVGLSQGYDTVVVRGDPAQRSFVAFYLREGHLIAVDAVNRPQEFMMSKRLVAQSVSVDPELLSDESIPLKSLLSI
ncbi:MAG: FAD-dependent oxidoreductase [Pseudomonas sp.]|uniref:NAD(P)/FAD-dependent oxidoreductase n=1 Tax=Pseudomonas sp. TaxID=306 RepID=UPI003981DA17